MVVDSREDEAGVARFFSEQSARSVKPQDGMARNPKVWKACWVIAAVHPHLLRHACGFALADQGADTRLIQDYLVCCSVNSL